jgi:hypothetical protein
MQPKFFQQEVPVIRQRRVTKKAKAFPFGKAFAFQVTDKKLPAVAGKRGAVAIAVAPFFTGFSFHNFNGATFNQATIQLRNCLLSSFLIGHFHKTKATAAVSEFVSNYFSGRYFSILRKKFS